MSANNVVAVLPALSRVRVTCDRVLAEQSVQEIDLRVCLLNRAGGGAIVDQIRAETLPLAGNIILANDTDRLGRFPKTDLATTGRENIDRKSVLL